MDSILHDSNLLQIYNVLFFFFYGIYDSEINSLLKHNICMLLKRKIKSENWVSLLQLWQQGKPNISLFLFNLFIK